MRQQLLSNTLDTPITPMFASGRVLIIDDELIIRDAAAAMLRAEGFVVDCAENGQRGLALFKNAPESYDLVILDLIMPVLNGFETFQQLKVLGVANRVIISSGYSLDNQVTLIMDEGAAAFLPKPFRRDKLLEIVHATLAVPK